MSFISGSGGGYAQSAPGDITAPPAQSPGASLSVLDFGARGNSFFDDTSAALKAITAGNGRYIATGAITDVVFPAGYEFLIGQIHILSGVRLRADGAAILPNLNNWSQNTAGLLFWAGTGILTDFGIYGGTWLGTGQETSTQTLFYTGSNRGVQDVTFWDMKITNWNIPPLYMRNPTRARALYNTIINPAGVTNTLNDINFVFDGGAAAGGSVMAIGNTIEGSNADSIGIVVTSGFTGAVRAHILGNTIGGQAGSAAASNNSGGIGFEIDAALAVANADIAFNDINATNVNAGAYAILAGNLAQNDTPGKVLIAANNIKSVGAAIAIGHVSPEVTVALNRIDAASFLLAGSTAPTQQFGNRFATTGQSQGRATLVAGTVSVNTAEIQAGDNVSLTVVTPGGTRGIVQLGTIVAGTSFVINSIQPGTASTLQAADTSTVFWQIIH